MSDKDKLEFLEETQESPEPEQEAETPTEPEQPEPEAVEAAEPESTGEDVEAAPPVAEPESPQNVPLTVVLDEREKRQKAERELEQLRQWRQRQEAMQRQQQQKAPDWYENPEAAAQYQQQRFQQEMQAQTLRQSRFFAERDYGPELVNEAYAFFDENPHLSQQLLQEPSPFHAAVEFYKKQKFLRDVGDDPDAFINARVEEELQKRLAAGGVQSPSKPKAPPASLSRAPASGRDAIAPGNAFDQMLPD